MTAVSRGRRRPSLRHEETHDSARVWRPEPKSVGGLRRRRPEQLSHNAMAPTGWLTPPRVLSLSIGKANFRRLPHPVSDPTAAQSPSPALAISDAEHVQQCGGKIRRLPCCASGKAWERILSFCPWAALPQPTQPGRPDHRRRLSTAALVGPPARSKQDEKRAWLIGGLRFGSARPRAASRLRLGDDDLSAISTVCACFRPAADDPVAEGVADRACPDRRCSRKAGGFRALNVPRTMSRRKAAT